MARRRVPCTSKPAAWSQPPRRRLGRRHEELDLLHVAERAHVRGDCSVPLFFPCHRIVVLGRNGYDRIRRAFDANGGLLHAVTRFYRLLSILVAASVPLLVLGSARGQVEEAPAASAGDAGAFPDEAAPPAATSTASPVDVGAPAPAASSAAEVVLPGTMTGVVEAPSPPLDVETPSFARRGQIVVSGDSSIGLSTSSFSGSSATHASAFFAPSLAYFIARNVSVGLAVDASYFDSKGYGADGSLVETKTTSLSVGPTLGLNVPLGERFSWYPQLTVGFEWTSATEHIVEGASLSVAVSPLGYPSTTELGPYVSLYAPFLLHAADHFFFGFGPGFFRDFGSVSGGPNVGGQRTELFTDFVVGGYWGGQPGPAAPSRSTAPATPLRRGGAVRVRQRPERVGRMDVPRRGRLDLADHAVRRLRRVLRRRSLRRRRVGRHLQRIRQGHRRRLGRVRLDLDHGAHLRAAPGGRPPDRPLLLPLSAAVRCPSATSDTTRPRGPARTARRTTSSPWVSTSLCSCTRRRTSSSASDRAGTMSSPTRFRTRTTRLRPPSRTGRPRGARGSWSAAGSDVGLRARVDSARRRSVWAQESRALHPTDRALQSRRAGAPGARMGDRGRVRWLPPTVAGCASGRTTTRPHSPRACTTTATPSRTGAATGSTAALGRATLRPLRTGKDLDGRREIVPDGHVDRLAVRTSK